MDESSEGGQGALTAQVTTTKRGKKTPHKTGVRAFSLSEFWIRGCGGVSDFGLTIPT